MSIREISPETYLEKSDNKFSYSMKESSDGINSPSNLNQEKPEEESKSSFRHRSSNSSSKSSIKVSDEDDYSLADSYDAEVAKMHENTLSKAEIKEETNSSELENSEQ